MPRSLENVHKSSRRKIPAAVVHISQVYKVPRTMEHTRRYNVRGFLCLAFSACFLLLLSFSGSVNAYKNYTVGDSLGWYDNTERPFNYQKWADAKNFSLGDFLIFNTDTNHSVVQTDNVTTYKMCDYDNSVDNDTIEWSSADPSNTATQRVTVAVPLLKEGITYFFSGDYDGDQCKQGQHFQINVTHGQGLPDSLKDPNNEAPAPNSPDVNGDDVVPDTIVPSANFDKPQEQESDHADNDKGQNSGALSLMCVWKLVDMNRNGVFILLGVALVL